MQLPHLIESGVPVTIAFRAMAAALQAIGRNDAHFAFAATWSAEEVAFGFLAGAVKSEWVKPDLKASVCILNLDASCAALAIHFGLSRELYKSMAVQFDCAYTGADFVELGLQEF